MTLINADGGTVVFKCEHCGAFERWDKVMTKRGFQAKLNKFHRQHDWRCEMALERQARKEKAIAASDEIIKRFTASCL